MGAAIAAGNQAEKGTWALLVKAAQIKRILIKCPIEAHSSGT